MPAQISISPPEEKDIEVLGDLLLRSKLSLSINRLLWKDWPNEAAQREQYTTAVSGAFKDPRMLDLKAVDDATGQIVGYICFTRKEMKAQPEPDDVLKSGAEEESPAPAVSHDIPPPMSADVLAGVMKACQEVASGLEFQESYELVFIVVDQPWRGKSIGSQLLQRGFAEAKAAGVPFCVTSEPAARSFFVKSGFIEVNHADMDLGVWAPPYTGFGVFRLTGMVWRPE